MPKSAALKYQSTTAPICSLRDFSKGRMTKYSTNTFLIPKNSASNSINVNYDTIIGSAVVRPGTTLLGTAVASNQTPLGLSTFTGSGGTPNLIVSAFSGASTASIYYYDTAWHTSALTTLNNTAKVRFAVLGGSVFMVNGVQAMMDSTDGNSWGTTNSITTDSVIPSLVFQTQNLLLAGGYSALPDRMYISAPWAPGSSPFIDWLTSGSSTDGAGYIDVNPDDGGYLTAFAATSTIVLAFKNNAMYRINNLNGGTSNIVGAQNICNVGAISQEAVTLCQGMVYFFSGIDIRVTDGTYPQQISRLGVQDFIDAIPPANWNSVCSGTDGLNVYFSIGTVTLNNNKDGQQTYTNVVLKFSTRDQTWSSHSYEQLPLFYTTIFNTLTNGVKMISADTTGSVQTVNLGTSDNGSNIFYFMETQEEEFGNRAHVNGFNSLITIFAKDAVESTVQVKSNDQDYMDVTDALPDRVNTVDGITFSGNYATFKWFGNTSTDTPVFEGVQIEEAIDEGLTATNT